jgi:hypothetical protein
MGRRTSPNIEAISELLVESLGLHSEGLIMAIIGEEGRSKAYF